MTVDLIGYGYAALVAIGGIIGFIKAGSTFSLLAGLLFGCIIAVGAWQISKNPKNHLIMLISSLTLTVVMGLRFYSSLKLMPAGLVFALSLLMAIRSLVKICSDNDF